MLPFNCIRQTLIRASELIADPATLPEMGNDLQRLINLYAEPPYPDWHYQVGILENLYAIVSTIDEDKLSISELEPKR